MGPALLRFSPFTAFMPPPLMDDWLGHKGRLQVGDVHDGNSDRLLSQPDPIVLAARSIRIYVLAHADWDAARLSACRVWPTLTLGVAICICVAVHHECAAALMVHTHIHTHTYNLACTEEKVLLGFYGHMQVCASGLRSATFALV